MINRHCLLALFIFIFSQTLCLFSYAQDNPHVWRYEAICLEVNPTEGIVINRGHVSFESLLCAWDAYQEMINSCELLRQGRGSMILAESYEDWENYDFRISAAEVPSLSKDGNDFIPKRGIAQSLSSLEATSSGFKVAPMENGSVHLYLNSHAIKINRFICSECLESERCNAFPPRRVEGDPIFYD